MRACYINTVVGGDEVHGDDGPELGLHDHAAEEAGAATGHSAVGRARDPVCGAQEHQPHRAETVSTRCVLGKLQSGNYVFITSQYE